MLSAQAPAEVAAASSPALERAWIEGLRAGESEPLARLHALLLKAARYEVGRRRATHPHVRSELTDDLALQAADDALVSVLRRLDDFRGESRFTTWAYKFALLEAAVKVRRLAWQGREVPLEPDTWTLVPAASPSPDRTAEQSELVAAVEAGMRTALTPHQRQVLVALTLNGVPIDVLAERLGSTRGALYKTLHDARKKLRAHLASAGFDLDGLEEGS